MDLHMELLHDLLAIRQENEELRAENSSLRRQLGEKEFELAAGNVVRPPLSRFRRPPAPPGAAG